MSTRRTLNGRKRVKHRNTHTHTLAASSSSCLMCESLCYVCVCVRAPRGEKCVQQDTCGTHDRTRTHKKCFKCAVFMICFMTCFNGTTRYITIVEHQVLQHHHHQLHIQRRPIGTIKNIRLDTHTHTLLSIDNHLIILVVKWAIAPIVMRWLRAEWAGWMILLFNSVL